MQHDAPGVKWDYRRLRSLATPRPSSLIPRSNPRYKTPLAISISKNLLFLFIFLMNKTSLLSTYPTSLILLSPIFILPHRISRIRGVAEQIRDFSWNSSSPLCLQMEPVTPRRLKPSPRSRFYESLIIAFTAETQCGHSVNTATRVSRVDDAVRNKDEMANGIRLQPLLFM